MKGINGMRRHVNLLVSIRGTGRFSLQWLSSETLANQLPASLPPQTIDVILHAAATHCWPGWFSIFLPALTQCNQVSFQKKKTGESPQHASAPPSVK